MKSVKNSETILPFSCCPLVFLGEKEEKDKSGKSLKNRETPEAIGRNPKTVEVLKKTLMV